MWVPSDWVADGLAGLAGVDVEIVGLGRDMGETGDIGHVPIPASAADVEFYVPSFFPSPASSAVLGQMPALRVVQALTAGVDWIRPHVPPSAALCNARGAHDASTAEWVVAATLGALRSFPLFSAEQAADRWAYQGTDQLATKNVLIVGYGAIGAAVERRLAGFEVTVKRVARRPRPAADGAGEVAGLDDLPSLLPEADVVVLLVPYTAETKAMAGRDFLAQMKDGALLVNAARGAVVDTAALVAEVASGRLRAALDVTDPEPLPPDHPLLQAPNVLVIPHVGSATTRTRSAMTDLAVDNVLAGLAGAPLPNAVTPTA